MPGPRLTRASGRANLSECEFNDLGRRATGDGRRATGDGLAGWLSGGWALASGVLASGVLASGVLASGVLHPSTAVALEAVFPAADECEWPTSVQVYVKPAAGHPAGYPNTEWFQCSGVFVGDLVLTAAHCIAYMDSFVVHFGEEANAPEFTDVPVACNAHPDGDWYYMQTGTQSNWVWYGPDTAWCELSLSHSLPIEPVMTPNGCEPQYLRDQLFGAGAGLYGRPTSLVASGGVDANATNIGTKRVAPMSVMFERYLSGIGTTAIHYLLQGQNDGNQMGDPATVFGGDSGGLAYFEMANGTWRTLGLVGTKLGLAYDLGDGLGQIQRVYAITDSTPRRLRWVEIDSGADITPCHNWDGAKWVWAGNPSCGGNYDLSPETGSAWASCSSDSPSSVGECNGWTPPGPDNKTAPTEAQGIIEVAKFGLNPPSRTGMFGRPAMPEWVGTIGNDSVTWTNTEATEVFSGRGHDTVFAGAGADQMHGGAGNDLLYGGTQDDIIVPGRGLDYVQGDAGNDTIIIRGTCEVAAGEVIDGGAGTDTLYSPVSLASLAALGASVSSIEKIIINNAVLNTGTCASTNTIPPLVLAP